MRRLTFVALPIAALSLGYALRAVPVRVASGRPSAACGVSITRAALPGAVASETKTPRDSAADGPSCAANEPAHSLVETGFSIPRLVSIVRDAKRPGAHRQALWALAEDGRPAALDALFETFQQRASLRDASDAAVCLLARPSEEVVRRLSACCAAGTDATRVSALAVLVRIARQAEDPRIQALARDAIASHEREVVALRDTTSFAPLRRSLDQVGSELRSLGY